MARVLLIDDDPGTVDTFGTILRAARHDVAGARTAGEGLTIARQFDPDVAVIDLRLPDRSGIETTIALREDVPSVACIVTTGYWSREAMREALRAGACDWLDKPVFDDALLDAVKRAVVGRRSRQAKAIHLEAAEPHGMTRLAETAVRFIGSHVDCPTFRLFGRAVGRAPGCIRTWCRTAQLAPRRFRDFSRALRAVYRLERDASVGDANLLQILDDRTLRKFRLTCGGTRTYLPVTVDDFLGSQQFIRNEQFIAAVKKTLESLRHRPEDAARRVAS